MTQDELDRSKPPKPKPPKDVPFPDYFDTTLTNGINLLVIENSKIPSVSVRLVFRDAGSFYDNGNYGIASMTAELLTKGTKNRTAAEIAEDIDFLGASLSSGSDWDGSYVTLSILKKHLSKGIDILADVVKEPAFSDDEITRMKEQRISSIIQSKDDPGSLSDKLFNRIIFEKKPYAYPPEGTEQSIKTLTRDDIISFYKNHYCPKKLILAFVGDITKEEAIKIVNDKFPDWKNACTTEVIQGNPPEQSSYTTKNVYIADKPNAVQSNLRIGHIGIARNNPDFLTVTVLNTILGGYFGSRINMNLREKHGFTYGARSSFNPRIYPGDFSVDTDVRNDVTDSSITEIFNELKRIVKQEVTDEELETVKNYLTGIFPLQLETANAVATRVINLKLYSLPKNYYNTYISNIQKLTKKDLLEAAQKYIKPDKTYIVIAGNSQAIAPKLKAFGPVEVFDANGNKITK